MKKLNKLTINPEKVINNDELVNLRGGYEGGGHWLACKDWTGETFCGLEVSSCNNIEYLRERCLSVCGGMTYSSACV